MPHQLSKKIDLLFLHCSWCCSTPKLLGVTCMLYSVVPLQKFLCSTNKNLLLESFFNQQELKESNNDLIECIDMIFNQQQNNDNTAKSSLGKLL